MTICACVCMCVCLRVRVFVWFVCLYLHVTIFVSVGIRLCTFLWFCLHLCKPVYACAAYGMRGVHICTCLCALCVVWLEVYMCVCAIMGICLCFCVCLYVCAVWLDVYLRLHACVMGATGRTKLSKFRFIHCANWGKLTSLVGQSSCTGTEFGKQSGAWISAPTSPLLWCPGEKNNLAGKGTFWKAWKFIPSLLDPVGNFP